MTLTLVFAQQQGDQLNFLAPCSHSVNKDIIRAIRTRKNKAGAPNHDFLPNALKTLFKLSRVLLDH